MMDLEKTMDLLISYWKDQGIPIVTVSLHKNNTIFESLPSDFVLFYEKVNGMKSYYPNDMDKDGFLFYPIESVKLVEMNEGSRKDIFLFAEYMHKSWCYGFHAKNDHTYEIGIIPYENSFKVIASNLNDFIALYLEDSPLLYDY